jgi:hypothetical protein
MIQFPGQVYQGRPPGRPMMRSPLAGVVAGETADEVVARVRRIRSGWDG